EKVKDPLLTTLAHENLGLVLSDQQRYPDALLQFQEQQRIAESNSNKLTAGYAIMNQGNMLWRLGRYEDAGKYFAWALNIANSDTPRNEDLLAWLNLFKAERALSQHDFGEAIARSKEAQIVGAKLKPVVVRATYLLGLAKSLNDDRSGRKLCEKAVELARGMRDPRPLPEALLALSEAALKSGDLQTAVASAAEAQQKFQQAGQRESEWRALVTQARASRQGNQENIPALISRASSILTGLQQEWGNHYDSYSARIDVQRDLKELGRLRGRD
ncbi:MAG TPA: tetratricopeptide repeat protein, partial [Pyrinomonadaceae bacterium]|nr:tetratricopeptide repeat protein [Pyrinomonadaceae bacterium]